MEEFFSWLTSQSGVSLLVALVALVGVLVTTGWNNKAADGRRSADQAAEEDRRKVEQCFQYEKWLKQLVVQEKARQRQAVSDFISEIREAERKLDSFSRETILSGRNPLDSTNETEFKLRRAFKKEDFYVDILTAVQRLELEITQVEVWEALSKLTDILRKELSDFTELRENNQLEQCGSSVALSASLQRAMNVLRNTARNHLHPIQLVDNKDNGK